MNKEISDFGLMQSFSPQAEDVLIRRVFGNTKNGFFVDVGSGGPIDGSVTWYFYDRMGWRGINIDPNPHYYNQLCKIRPEDINLNLAINNSPDIRQMKLSLYDNHPNRSTVKLNLMKDYGESDGFKDVTVATAGLEGILDKYVNGREILVLKIDVEGSEKDVLESFDISRWMPRIIVVEATYPGTRAATYHNWESIILACGYKRSLFDGLNCWYAYDDDIHEALSVPVNVFDHYDAYRWHKY